MTHRDRSRRAPPSPQNISIFDKIVGLVAFALLSAAAAYLLIWNPELRSEALVTIYFAINVGVLSAALLGGTLHLTTNIEGVGIRAAGGAAAFALVMLARFFIDPISPPPPAVSQDNFVQSYGRVFGAMEFPILLRILARQHGDMLRDYGTRVSSDPGDETLTKFHDLIVNGCPRFDDDGVALDGADPSDIYSSGCALEVDGKLIRSVAKAWPYPSARIADPSCTECGDEQRGSGSTPLYCQRHQAGSVAVSRCRLPKQEDDFPRRRWARTGLNGVERTCRRIAEHRLSERTVQSGRLLVPGVAKQVQSHVR